MINSRQLINQLRVAYFLPRLPIVSCGDFPSPNHIQRSGICSSNEESFISPNYGGPRDPIPAVPIVGYVGGPVSRRTQNCCLLPSLPVPRIYDACYYEKKYVNNTPYSFCGILDASNLNWRGYYFTPNSMLKLTAFDQCPYSMEKTKIPFRIFI